MQKPCPVVDSLCSKSDTFVQLFLQINKYARAQNVQI